MSRWVLVWIACAGCDSAAGGPPLLAPLPEDVVQAAQARIEALQASAVELRAIDATLNPAGSVPRPDLGVCPVQLPRTAYVASASAQLADVLRRWSAVYPLAIVRPGEPVPRPGDVASGEIDALAGALTSELHRTFTTDGQRNDEIDQLQRLIALPPPEAVVVFVADEWHDAQFDAHPGRVDQVAAAIGATEAFEPGSVRGRAYLWSVKTRAILCATDVTATSSEGMTAPVDDAPSDHPAEGIRATLAEDLRSQLGAAIAGAMQSAAGPATTKPNRARR